MIDMLITSQAKVFSEEINKPEEQEMILSRPVIYKISKWMV